jgi:hypothetical protein
MVFFAFLLYTEVKLRELMFDFIEKIMQPKIESVEGNMEIYIFFGIIISLVWIFWKNGRRTEMKKLAEEFNLSFRPYAIKWDLIPSLSFITKNFGVGIPINLIEGKVGDQYYIIFDFYYQKWGFFNNEMAERLITFINGKYYKNCSVDELKQAIDANDFSGFISGDKISKYVRFREVAVLNTYGNIRLRNNNVSLENVLSVINAFRSINYGSFLGKAEDAMLMNKLNTDAVKNLEEIENKLKSWGHSIDSNIVKIILEKYLDILHLKTVDDIMKEISINKKLK